MAACRNACPRLGQVLRHVTKNGREAFALLARRQMDAAEAGDAEKLKGGPPPRCRRPRLHQAQPTERSCMPWLLTVPCAPHYFLSLCVAHNCSAAVSALTKPRGWQA